MTLAIDGGKPVFEQPAQVPAWPPIYPETAETLESSPEPAENSPESAAPVSAGEQPRGEEAENDG